MRSGRNCSGRFGSFTRKALSCKPMVRLLRLYCWDAVESLRLSSGAEHAACPVEAGWFLMGWFSPAEFFFLLREWTNSWRLLLCMTCKTCWGTPDSNALHLTDGKIICGVFVVSVQRRSQECESDEHSVISRVSTGWIHPAHLAPVLNYVLYKVTPSRNVAWSLF